jgi:myo-inositol-1(or 4)-monophosphatase
MSNQFLGVAIETALEAGGVLLSEFARPPKVRPKGELDLVTQADRKSEQTIVARLQRRFPKHSILSEEGGGKEIGARYRWLVDPLDGTTNFVHGYPCFAVSLALQKAGELLVGVVYQPITKELFVSSIGNGAYLNEKPIHVSSVDHLSASLLATGFPSLKRTPSPNINYYWNFTLRSHGVRRDGSSALDLASIACGRFDGFWEFGLHPWDTAAGVLLVREAGGIVTNFAGQAYGPGDYEILASNGHIHAEMREAVLSVHDEQSSKNSNRVRKPGAERK